MNVEIKKLSPELINGYIEYFDKIAFIDNKEWAGCYCVHYHWNNSLENELKNYTGAGGKCFKKELAIKYINEGKLQGYLAYVDGVVVGWCNANDKTSYDRLNKKNCPELYEDSNDNEKIKSIVCYSIAPSMRRKGIASQLLKSVCEDALKEGYNFIEAYPTIGEISTRSYHGPYSIYEKCGFSLHKNLDDIAIVRKYL